MDLRVVGGFPHLWDEENGDDDDDDDKKCNSNRNTNDQNSV